MCKHTRVGHLYIDKMNKYEKYFLRAFLDLLGPCSQLHQTNRLELSYLNARSNSQSLVLTSISQTTGDQVDTHWMFESGIMDVFIMLGPAPKDVSRLVNEAF